MAINDLVDAARLAAKNAHAPYSKFYVGAAVLLTDGTIVSGCNFENASYGLTLCAETIALGTVTAMGKLSEVREIALIGGKPEPQGLLGHEPVRPCGRCRQIINEAAQVSDEDVLIHCASGDGSALETHRISTLLPHPFGPHDLGYF